MTPAPSEVWLIGGEYIDTSRRHMPVVIYRGRCKDDRRYAQVYDPKTQAHYEVPVEDLERQS